MRTIRLTIEYDGTEYVGWQIQPNGPTVQAAVESALAELLDLDAIRIHSSGRTDAGVHAFGMEAHFETDRDLPMKAFREGLNRLLPADVAIRQAQVMPARFHARYSAQGKWYRYTLYRGAVRSPLTARTSWHLFGPLDLSAMKDAARLMVGEHDFSAFRSSSCAAKTTRRSLFSIVLQEEGDRLYLDFKGSGFLKNMVRMLVGTLVDVGRGRMELQAVSGLLLGKSGLRCGPTAPPQGLCLMEVSYLEGELQKD
jgi:tRNA pseudouridine38-40 synthase